jgi:bifunctional DNA-binding transcriptional regulator/antitoxin component of YhaV-PrlF toxin-antitoxin module
LSSDRLTSIRCKCGGRLKSSVTEVEFFGIDFGVRPADVCTECGSEYISQEAMEELEEEVKKRGLFGLERRGRIAKSGNSLVIRIPKEIAESLRIKRDVPVVMYPSDQRKLVVEVEG